MADITVKIEDYNALGLVARARLTLHNLTLNAQTATLADMCLARVNQMKALKYINDNAALVKAGRLNSVYTSLVDLAHEAECVAEVRNQMPLRYLRSKVAEVAFGFAEVYSELDKLIIDDEEGEK